MASKRTTIYLDDQDRQALSLLQDRYGLSTLSDVIRFALRSMAAEPPQHGIVLQEPSLPDFRPNGSESLPHSPALVELVSQPVGRALAAGSTPQEEEVAILVEKLQRAQEELVLTQEELARAQEELHQTYQELQRQNQALVEMSAVRESRVPDPQEWPTQRARSETSPIVLVSKQQVEVLLRQSAPIREENQRIRRQVRTEVTRLQKARAV
jgi:hypothetical protein